LAHTISTTVCKQVSVTTFYGHALCALMNSQTGSRAEWWIILH